jgi:ATP synthase protein I
MDPPSLDDLDTRLRAAQARQRIESGDQSQRARASGTGMGFGFRVVVELVAGIAVGTLIGYGLDHWLGSKPWLMVAFLFLGATAGVVNVYRAAKGLDDSVGLGQAQRRRETAQGGSRADDE